MQEMEMKPWRKVLGRHYRGPLPPEGGWRPKKSGPTSRRGKLKAHRRFRRKAPKRWCSVYSLREADGPVRYIGQTRLLPEERLRWHLKAVRKLLASGGRLTPAQKWLAGLETPPIVEVVDSNGIWDISEAVWIDRLRREGAPLLNISSVVR